MKINEYEIKQSNYSLTDSFGSVFFWNERVFRGLKDEKAFSLYTNLRDCGLLEELEEKKLFPITKITDYKTSEFQFILEHEKITPLSFVFEWPFEMIKTAGQCILEVNLCALKYDYQTIDAHPYNVLFKGCNPMFIDLGSFIPIETINSNWGASEEFNSYFQYALKVWNNVSYKMARRIFADDFSVFTKDELNRLSYVATPRTGRYILSLINLLLKVKNRLIHIKENRAKHLRKLSTQLSNIKANAESSSWGNYHNEYYDKNELIISDRFQFIIKKVDEYQIKSIVELAGNAGLLSFLILKHCSVERIVCTDYDEIAVNKMFNLFRRSDYAEKISPALIDFMRPVGVINAGKASERFESEAVFALAVIHHLILGQNYDIDTVLNRISEYTSKYAFIEFMPLGLWGGNSSPQLPDWYTEEWFKNSFLKFFKILEITKLETNRVLFIGEKL